jgi:hypothetical protein
MAQKRKALPSRKKIAEAHGDYADCWDCCWHCARDTHRLERHHVVPVALGGTDDVENLALLCGPCHREAPGIPDAEWAWKWIRSGAETMRIHARIMHEYKAVEGEYPLDAHEHWTSERHKAFLDQTSLGFGDLSYSTSAWAMAMASKPA